MKNQPDKEFLTLNELAEYLNISKKFIIKHTANRRLPGIKMGRIWRYRKKEIEKRLLSGKLLLDVPNQNR